MSKYTSTLIINVEYEEPPNEVEEVEITGELNEDLVIEHISWDRSIYGKYENGEIDDYIEKNKHHIVNRLTDKVKERFVPDY